MREDGDRPRGLAEGALLVVEGEPVQPVADRRGQSGVRAADLGHAVGVLHDPDRLPLGVAEDAHPVAGDPSGFGREERLRARLLGLVEAAPAPARHEHEQDHGDRGEHGQPFERPEHPPWPRARPRCIRLDLGRDPDLVPADLEERRLEPFLAAEVLDVGLLRGLRPRGAGGAPRSRRPATRKFDSSARSAKNGSQGGTHLPQLGHEEPGATTEHDRGEPQAPDRGEALL